MALPWAAELVAFRPEARKTIKITMVLPDRIYIALGPWHFGDLRNIFLPNVGEDHKKSKDLSAGPLANTAPYYGKLGFG